MSLDTGLGVTTSVSDRLRAVVRATPHQAAVTGAGEEVSFGELDRRADEAARALRDLGVVAGDLVALELDRSVDAITCIVALWRLGAGYVPVDPRAPAPYRAAMHRLCGATLSIVEHGDTWRAVATERAGDASVHSPAPDATVPRAAALGATDPAYAICTSGTSGRRRCVLVGHAQLASLADALRATVYADSNDRRLRVAMNGPLAFDTSVKQLVQLAEGHTLVLVPEPVRSSSWAMREHLIGHDVDVVDATPSLVRRWLADGVVSTDATPIARRLLVGGEAIDAELWQALAGLDTLRAFNLYGPTECTVDATWAPITGTDPTLGVALPDTDIVVEGPNGRALPDFVVGELVIRGPRVAWGYLDGEPGGFGTDGAGRRRYATGDLARRRRDGTFEFIGRADTQTKVHGVRVDLSEVEHHLRSLPGIDDAAAALRPGGSMVAAVVVSSSAPPAGAVAPTTEGIRRALAERVPMTHVPAEVVVADALPLTDRGKIDRAAIAEWAVDLGGAARPGTESQVAAAMARIVGGEPLERDESFFRRGGDSLDVLELVSVLADELGGELDIVEVSAAPTPAGIAAIFHRTAPPAPAPSAPRATRSLAPGPRTTGRSIGDAIAAGVEAPLDAVALTCVPDLARPVIGSGDDLRRMLGDLPALASVRETGHGRLGFVLLSCYASEAATHGAALVGPAIRLGATYGARSASLTGQLAPATDAGRAVGARLHGVTVTTGQGSTVAAMTGAWRRACAARGRSIADERVVVVGGGVLTAAFAAYVAQLDAAPADLRHLEEHPAALRTATTVVVAGVPFATLDLGALDPTTIVVEYGTGFAADHRRTSGPEVVSGGSLVTPRPTDDLVHLPAELVAVGPELVTAALELESDRIAACALAALLVAEARVPAVIGTPAPTTIAAYAEAVAGLGYTHDPGPGRP